MNRRGFLHLSGCALAGFAAGKAGAFPAPKSESFGWRFYQVTTEVEVLHPVGTTQIWVPRPLLRSTAFQREAETFWRCHEGDSKSEEESTQSLGMIHARFAPGARPYIKVTNQVACRDWSVDLTAPGSTQHVDKHVDPIFLRNSDHDSTSGSIVRTRASQIAGRYEKDLDKARAIYEWIVTNTWRDPHTRGCGVGNVDFMLESGDLGGKCADINALFVDLARAAGLPAREVYGIRIAPSQMGFKSLGATSEDVTRAQHCRAEVYLDAFGWVPVDPADVRKVVLEEPGHLNLSSQAVEQTRSRLFGSWEMNWMAYNFAENVSLPGSKQPPLRFFMYPQAETADGRVDCLDPQTFRYTISAKPIAL